MLKEYRGRIPFLLNEYTENIVYLCSSNRNIEDYYNVLVDIFDGKILKLESSIYSEELEKDNYELLETLTRDKRFVILISLEAYLREYFSSGKKYEFKLGKKIDLKEFIEELEKNGYQKIIWWKREMSIVLGGDILDIFPQNSENPLRIEFGFDDEIERIAYFDIETQKSIEKKLYTYMYINNNKEEKKDFYSLVKKNKNIRFFIENSELLNYKLDELIERENFDRVLGREKLENLKGIAEEIEIIKFSHEELLNFENQEYVKKLGENENLKVTILSKKRKDTERFLKIKIFNLKNIHFMKVIE